MRTFLAIFGALALAVVAFVVTLFVLGVQRLKATFKEATAYVDEAVPAIATNWDGRELVARAAPELTAKLKEGEVDAVFSMLRSQLGPMTEYRGAACQDVRYEVNTEDGGVAFAACRAEAAFEKSDAAFRVSIIKRKGEWRFLGFFVDFEINEEGASPPVEASLRDEPEKIEVSFGPQFVALSSAPHVSLDVGLTAPGALRDEP